MAASVWGIGLELDRPASDLDRPDRLLVKDEAAGQLLLRGGVFLPCLLPCLLRLGHGSRLGTRARGVKIEGGLDSTLGHALEGVYSDLGENLLG